MLISLPVKVGIMQMNTDGRRAEYEATGNEESFCGDESGG